VSLVWECGIVHWGNRVIKRWENKGDGSHHLFYSSTEKLDFYLK